MIETRKTRHGLRYVARVKARGERLSKTFDVRSDAEKWVNSIRFKRDQGYEFQAEPVTVQQMFDAYVEFAEEQGRAHSTLKMYKGQFLNYVKPFYGENDMLTVSYGEHQAFIKYLKKQFKLKSDGKRTDKPLSSATRNRIRSLMQVMHSEAIKGRWFNNAIKTNPFSTIRKANEDKKLIRYFAAEEMSQFLQANEKSHYYPLLLLMLNTGLRVGEALGIHREQISNNLLSIDRQYDNSQNKVVHRTKSKLIRVIYVVDEVLKVLPLHRTNLLFVKPDGSAITTGYFSKFILSKACKAAGVKILRPHELRHTFAAHYLMDGGSIWDLSKILGHQSVEVTEKHYAHFSIDHIKNRMKPVERKLRLISAA